MQNKEFVPSKYQKDFFDWIQNGEGNAVLKAVPGGSKTTTLVKGAEYIEGSAIFVAFNKHIVDELKKKLPSKFEVKTLHSLGLACVSKAIRPKKVNLDSSKYYRLAKEPAFHLFEDLKTRHPIYATKKKQQYINAWTIQQDLKQFIEILQCTLTDITDESAVADTAQHYDLDILSLPLSWQLLKQYWTSILEEGEKTAKEEGTISYSDMIWLPGHWDLQPPQYDWVLVDELQDLSEAQRNLALKMLHSKSRFIGAGDFLQAIYGFGGSDCLSMQKSIQDTNSKVLPLNICYRCPSSHVEFLKPLAPHIETWEGANPGILQYLDEEKLEDTLQEKDYVLCRKTAPLVKLCISLIKQRKPATVKGKNIGKQLVNMFIQISEMRKFTYKDYPIFHNLFRDREIDKIKKRDRGDVKEQISTFSDKLDALYACYESFATETADQLKDAILNLFSDKDSLITLSTIHRFKGLEAKRVFILEWNSLSFKALEDKWQSQQEVNVSFVGLSRSLKEMYLVQRNAPPVKTVPTLIKESKSSVVSIYDLLAEEDSLKTLEEWLEEDLELVGSTEEINYLEHCLAKS